MLYGILIGIIVFSVLLILCNRHDFRASEATNHGRSWVRIIGFAGVIIAGFALIGLAITGA